MRTRTLTTSTVALLSCALEARPCPAQCPAVDEQVIVSPDTGDAFGGAAGLADGIVGVGAIWDESHRGAAYVFVEQPGGNWIQTQKLVPADSIAADEFGSAVALSGDTAIIGAHHEGHEPFWWSGAAYVFTDDGSGTFVEGVKLTASDSGYGYRFGTSVAMDGNTAIVGAPDVGVVGDRRGAAYVFRDLGSGNWVEVQKLTASDESADSHFGSSVAVDGDTAIIGAWGDDDQRGAAYVFRESGGTWTQVDKLTAPDGAADDLFGYCVDLRGRTAIAGAHGHDSDVNDTGAAYVFRNDDATWFLAAKLTASDAAASDWFGSSVSLGGGTALVGATGKDDVELNAGAAYLFALGTGGWVETQKITVADPAMHGRLGSAVAAEPATVLVMSSGNESAHLFSRCTDSDNDGLPDEWELHGIPYVDGNGDERRYALDPDALPLHKDLFVEVDAMTDLALSDEAVQQLELAFGNAPVPNADGDDGITLHVIRDDTDLPYTEVWATDGCWPTAFAAYRADHYGTAGERGSENAAAILEAKSRAFRYCIVADEADAKIGGCGERPGDDFVIFLGDGLSPTNEAAVFMHELGHNLGLRHGGGDDVNGKTNYPSVMNYTMSYQYAWNMEFWRLDYSREQLDNLTELVLDESHGVGTAGGFHADVWLPYGVNEVVDGETIRTVKYVPLDGTPTDFGDDAGSGFLDGVIGPLVIQDLNYVSDPPPGIALPVTASLGDVHAGHDDWANITLATPAALGDPLGAPEFPTDELTTDARDWIDASFPAPPVLVCPADLTGDGAVDFGDLLVVLSTWSTPGGDVDGDGTTGFADLVEVLSTWGPCV